MNYILDENKLAEVSMRDRILLISQCLRPSKTCRGKFTKSGLVCVEDCDELCVIQQCKECALKLGYQGVCIAAGGSMALNFVKEHEPKGIVAVACHKELEEGVKGVIEMSDGIAPPIAVVPLLKEGCVDTQVDVNEVIRTISLMPKRELLLGET